MAFMKNFVIYDLETSGIDSAFSSILQAAAICVDENFNEIDRFNLRGKMKKEYPIPHPKALLVNDVSIDQLKNHENSNFTFSLACIASPRNSTTFSDLRSLDIS